MATHDGARRSRRHGFRFKGIAVGIGRFDCPWRCLLRPMSIPRQANAGILTSLFGKAVMGAIFVALAVCGWFAAVVPPFGVEANAVTFSTAAATLAVSAALARRHQPWTTLREDEANRGRLSPPAAARDTSLRLPGLFAWSFAALYVVAVELWELFHVPRSAYPTLSSLANEVLGPGHRVARAVAFLCWGACGLVVARRPGRRS